MSEMEEYASLTNNEKTPIDDPVVPEIPAPLPAYTPTAPPAVPQMEPKASATVSPLTYQPEPNWQPPISNDTVSASVVDQMYGISICFAIVCCLCGSPLTLACFIPAIFLTSTVCSIAYRDSALANSVFTC